MNKNYILQNKICKNSKYSGENIKIFNDKNNWYKWQKDIVAFFFDKDGKIKKANDRKIFHTVCFEGNSGKSSFFKD